MHNRCLYADGIIVITLSAAPLRAKWNNPQLSGMQLTLKQMDVFETGMREQSRGVEQGEKENERGRFKGQV